MQRQCSWLWGWHLSGWEWGCWQGWIQHPCGLQHRQGRACLWEYLHPAEDHHSQDVQPEVLAANPCKPGPLQSSSRSIHPPLLPTPLTRGAGIAQDHRSSVSVFWEGFKLSRFSWFCNDGMGWEVMAANLSDLFRCFGGCLLTTESRLGFSGYLRFPNFLCSSALSSGHAGRGGMEVGSGPQRPFNLPSFPLDPPSP